MADNPYRQKAPLPGQSVDLVPDESPITLADMIRQEGGIVPKGLKKKREDVARRVMAPTPAPTPEAQRAFDLNQTLGQMASDAFYEDQDKRSFDSMSEGENDDQISLAEMLKRDRKKFQGLYGNDRVEAVAGAGGIREDPSQPWPREKTDWVHGTLDDLRESTGGSWEINYEGEGGEIEFIDLNTGETTSEYWDGKQ